MDSSGELKLYDSDPEGDLLYDSSVSSSPDRAGRERRNSTSEVSRKRTRSSSPGHDLAGRYHEGDSAESKQGHDPARKRLFDPRHDGESTSQFVFSPPQEVAAYMETHFRRVLSDEERKDMTSTHPRPKTDALMTPKVDDEISAWLGNKFPKAIDGRFAAVQTAIMAATGPAACAWSDILNLEEDAMVPASEVAEIFQRTLVLLGNASALIGRQRRTTLIEAGEKELAKYAKEYEPTEGRHLFGPNFTEILTTKVKASTAIKDASRMVRPRDNSNNSSRSGRGGFGRDRDNRSHGSGRQPFRHGSRGRPGGRNTAFGHRGNRQQYGNSRQDRRVVFTPKENQ